MVPTETCDAALSILGLRMWLPIPVYLSLVNSSTPVPGTIDTAPEAQEIQISALSSRLRYRAEWAQATLLALRADRYPPHPFGNISY